MAKGTGNYPDVYDELKELRLHADDGLTPDLMGQSPILCRLLGDGDPFLATGELRDRLRTAAAHGDRALLAFLRSFDPVGDATARLTHAGNKLFVEYRRARDLSDLGMLKTSELIGSRQQWQVPFMGVALSILGWTATIESYVMVANGFVRYGHPRHLVNGVELDPRHRRVDQGKWERHLYGPIELDLRGGDRQFVLRRIGTSRLRVHTTIRSDNPAVDVRSSLQSLSHVLEFVVGGQDANGDQLPLFSAEPD